MRMWAKKSIVYATAYVFYATA